MPQISSPSRTARCSDPAASISTVASIASWVGGTVGTGLRAAARAGASSGTPSTAIAARTPASDKIPSPPPSIRISSAETPFCPRRAAAARNGSSGSQNSARLMTSDTGVVPTSGSPCTVWPATVRRFRIEFATKAAPASVPRIRRPASAPNRAHVEGSRARTVNAGAIPVSRDGCPKHSPGSST